MDDIIILPGVNLGLEEGNLYEEMLHKRGEARIRGSKTIIDYINIIGKLDNIINLYISDNNIDDQNMSALINAIYHSHNLTSINIFTSNIINLTSFINVLHDIKYLTQLSIIECNIDHSDAINIAMLLPNNITILNLSINNIGDIGTTAIAQSLIQNGNSLFELNLNHNNIGDPGAVAIAEALKYNKKLNTLSLSHNNIGNIGIEHIGLSLKHNQHVGKLYLSHNNNHHNVNPLDDILKYNKYIADYSVNYDIPIDIDHSLNITVNATRNLTILNNEIRRKSLHNINQTTIDKIQSYYMDNDDQPLSQLKVLQLAHLERLRDQSGY
jgi:Ran GTPase-activating protein (RanGAP) involved in mRNA processing and transport